MASSYFRFTFTTVQPEILIAFLSDWPFAAFEEDGELLHAYLHQDFNVERTRREVQQACHAFFDSLELTPVPDVNWNAQWEASFEPIAIGDFCYIRASFHPPAKHTTHEIVIDPKMSFGTGHHATTKMMIAQMSTLDFRSRSILDMGCGTGILAILAHKLGAADILAVDIDENCITNSKENFVLNNARAELIQGGADVLPDKTFDIILANINRNALLDMLGILKTCLGPDGKLIVSGILTEDTKSFVDQARSVGLYCNNRTFTDEWACLNFHHIV